jgi:hypothetical protein
MSENFPFKHIEEGALQAYKWSLNRIKWDLEHADSELSGDAIDFSNLIHAAAHLRLVIENTVFVGLFSNRQLLLEAEKNLSAKRDMGDTRKLIRKVNPHYWPRGQRPPENGDTKVALEPHPDALGEDEYSREWGNLSRLLHGQNPYLVKTETPSEVLESQLRLSERLHATLDFHFIYLPSGEILYGRIIGESEQVQMLQTGN